MNIMTVDDSSTVRQMVVLALKSTGHRVIEAENAPKALELLQTEKIDLIFCDFNMPGMDGGQLVRQIKAQENYRSIPVIMLTTEIAKNRLSQLKEAGASGWINKPFKPESLVAAVEALAKKFGLA